MRTQLYSSVPGQRVRRHCSEQVGVYVERQQPPEGGEEVVWDLCEVVLAQVERGQRRAQVGQLRVRQTQGGDGRDLVAGRGKKRGGERERRV